MGYTPAEIVDEMTCPYDVDWCDPHAVQALDMCSDCRADRRDGWHNGE